MPSVVRGSNATPSPWPPWGRWGAGTASSLNAHVTQPFFHPVLPCRHHPSSVSGSDGFAKDHSNPGPVDLVVESHGSIGADHRHRHHRHSGPSSQPGRTPFGNGVTESGDATTLGKHPDDPARLQTSERGSYRPHRYAATR